MGYRKELKEKNVETTTQNFQVIDSRFVFPTKLDLFMEEIMDLYNIHSFTVKNSNGVEYYRCGYNLNINSIVVYSTYGEPLCNLNDSVSFLKNKQDICGGVGKDIIASIKDKESSISCKYVVEFTNMATKQKEKFDMTCDNQYRTCGIFNGKEKNGAQMICKIWRNYYYASSYKLEISPGVDSALMVALGLYFMERSMKSTFGPSIIIKNYFIDVPHRPVEAPLHQLPLVGSKYLSEKPQTFKIEKIKSMTGDHDYKIYNVDGVEVFKSRDKSLRRIIYSSENDEPIINIADAVSGGLKINLANSLDGGIKKKIYLGDKKGDQSIGNIREIRSNVINKYVIEFLNSKTDIYETFTVNCDVDFYVGTILYDNGQGTTSMVGKLLKDQYERRYSQLEIAPGVDHVIIIAVALFFLMKSDSNLYKVENPNSRNKPKNFYLYA